MSIRSQSQTQRVGTGPTDGGKYVGKEDGLWNQPVKQLISSSCDNVLQPRHYSLKMYIFITLFSLYFIFVAVSTMRNNSGSTPLIYRLLKKIQQVGRWRGKTDHRQCMCIL